ncbi:MAG: abortive infection family protein [Candidatus Omnitrophica bacterium]|nr:abortive infection family protein [Candidatus Omnitrophota bacterium]
MSDLSAIEKRKLERALGMHTGYVLNFSDRTLSEFVLDSTGLHIYEQRYNYSSGSKANRMRAFWKLENNHMVAKLLGDFFEAWEELRRDDTPVKVPEECIKIVHRLRDSAPVPDIQTVVAISDEQGFEQLAKSVREYIERNEPEAGLDRLHTYLVKFFRSLCKKHNIEFDQKKPLHSLAGEYIKALKKKGRIQSEMTERILKSTISVLESFNNVRNNQSYAHDNEEVLNYSESILIFANVTSAIRFIQSIEAK